MLRLQGVPRAPHPSFVKSQERPVQKLDASSKPRQRLRQIDWDLRPQVGPFSREAFMGLGLQHDLQERVAEEKPGSPARFDR